MYLFLFKNDVAEAPSVNSCKNRLESIGRLSCIRLLNKILKVFSYGRWKRLGKTGTQKCLYKVPDTKGNIR